MLSLCIEDAVGDGGGFGGGVYVVDAEDVGSGEDGGYIGSGGGCDEIIRMRDWCA